MRGERKPHEGGFICTLTVIHDGTAGKKTELDSLNSNSQTFITQLGLALHSDFIKAQTKNVGSQTKTVVSQNLTPSVSKIS